MTWTERLRDIRAFNLWRAAHPDEPVDLTGLDLRGLDLSEGMLAGVVLDDANLQDVALRDAVLSGSSLARVSLERADLRGAKFGPTELFKAELSDNALGSALSRPAMLSGASLEGCRANYTNFKECDLEEVNLVDCDLRDAYLSHTVFADELPHPLPPASGDLPGLLARLEDEPPQVKRDMMLTAILISQGGPSGDDTMYLLNILAEAMGFGRTQVDDILAYASEQVQDTEVTPPESHWLRRSFFSLMCTLVAAAPQISGVHIQTLAFLGKQWGYTNAAIMRVVGENLDIHIELAE